MESFYEYLTKEGYLFDKETIENYLLSLKVKPFTILTGNSGTGKTKLSQLFSKYVSTTFIETADNTLKNEKEDYLITTAKVNYSSWANNGWTLPAKDLKDLLPVFNVKGKYDIEIDGEKTKATINLLPQLYYDNEELKKYFKELDEKTNVKTIDIKIKNECLEKFSSHNYEKVNEIILKQNSNKTAYEQREWTLSNKIYDYLPIQPNYINCKIEVNDIISKAKFRIIFKIKYDKNEKIQNYLKNNEGKEVSLKIKNTTWDFDIYKSPNKKVTAISRESNYKIIPVGANWTENRNIVGYYNLITEEYQSTPAYELIKEANENPEEPYFLILDEMNLSHVERYFADFLSAIESGEEIPLYGIDESLKIPNNLFIIGTVNVDETTYMFSPKVLDRANTIEFETFPADRYMFENYNLQSPEGDIKYLEDPLTDLNLKNMKISEIKEKFQDVKVDGEEFWTVFTKETYKFQEILKQSGFEFGFRVINEITRFMYVAWKYEGQPENWVNWYRYFDAQIKQKMLPKLHGSEKIIGDTLEDLKKETYNKYPTSNKKLEEMLKVLEKQRYVSFIN